MIENMVDGMEILSEHDKFTWFKVVLRPDNTDQFLTYVFGADNVEAIKSNYSPETGFTVMSISQIKKDGSFTDENEWRRIERSLFIKQICGSFYTPDVDELQAIDEMLETNRKNEDKLILALIKNYVKTGNLNIREDSSLLDNYI